MARMNWSRLNSQARMQKYGREARRGHPGAGGVEESRIILARSCRGPRERARRHHRHLPELPVHGDARSRASARDALPLLAMRRARHARQESLARGAA